MKVVSPVPPPATVEVPLMLLAKVKVVPEFVMVWLKLRPL